MTLYETLGVEPDASQAQIKKAFRQRALKAHPDQGGSREAMEVLQHAYDVLSDVERRARYDATGEEDVPVDPVKERQAAALRLLRDVISMVVDQPVEVDTVDVKSVIIQKVKSEQSDRAMLQRKLQDALLRANKMTKRFIKDGADEEDIVAGILKAKAAKLQTQIDMMEASIQTFQVVADMLDGYTYEVDAAPKMKPSFVFDDSVWSDILGPGQ